MSVEIVIGIYGEGEIEIYRDGSLETTPRVVVLLTVDSMPMLTCLDVPTWGWSYWGACFFMLLNSNVDTCVILKNPDRHNSTRFLFWYFECDDCDTTLTSWHGICRGIFWVWLQTNLLMICYLLVGSGFERFRLVWIGFMMDSSSTWIIEHSIQI